MGVSRRIAVAGLWLLLAAQVQAEVVWRGDFETGDKSQWDSEQSMGPDRLQVVDDPVRQGAYSLRVEVRQGDDPINASGNRNELVKHDGSSEGTEYYYAWSTLWPSDYPLTPTWQVFTQWHHPGSSGAPPVRFVLGYSGYPEYNDTIFFVVNGSDNLWTMAPLTLGVWHDFILHIKWSANASVGFVELWYDGQLVLPKTYIRTLFNSEDTNYLKMGLYRDEATQPTAVLYHDAMVQATTFDDVRPDQPQPDGGGADGAAEDADGGDSGPGGLELVAKRAEGPVVVDGDLSEFADAPAAVFADSGRGSDDNLATVRALWDDTNLYLSYLVSDTKLNSLVTAPGTGRIWEDDGLEIYIDRFNDHADWKDADDHKFMVNLHNVQEAEGEDLGDDLRSAVSLVGTLNDNGDVDSAYRIEVAVAWSSLGGAPSAGERIGVNFCAGDLDDPGDGYQFYDWADIPGSFDQPDKFGDLILEGPVDCTEGSCDGADGGLDAADASDSACASGLTDCGGICVDLDSSPFHCGACSNACGPGDVCDRGECGPYCGPGTVEKNGACVSDEDGGCGCRAVDAGGIGQLLTWLLMLVVAFRWKGGRDARHGS